MNDKIKPLLALLGAALLLALASCRAGTPEVKLPSTTSQSSDGSQSEPNTPAQKGEVPQQKEDTSQPEGNSSQQTPSTPAAPEASIPTAPPAVDPAPDARTAYARILEDLLYRYTLPDGTTADSDYFDDMSETTFAIADLDGDGREELVLLVRPAIYAGYAGYILDFDESTGNTTIQFEGFPSFVFYSNGTFTENDSHAQGSWSKQFWPHTLYRYLPETDRYEAVGHVDAWEKDFTGDQYPFPTEKDTSGAGILYYINIGYLSSIQDRINLAVDQSAYEAWLEPYLGDAQPVELEYLLLTEESIEQLR